MGSGKFFTQSFRAVTPTHLIRTFRAKSAGLLAESRDAHLRGGRSNSRICGTYILRPNQPGGGSHVANAAFMVSPARTRRGVGRAMAEHCLHEAARLGFRAMQFNFVISTNEAAIALGGASDLESWERCRELLAIPSAVSSTSAIRNEPMANI